MTPAEQPDARKAMPPVASSEMLAAAREVLGSHVEDTDSDYQRIYAAFYAAAPAQTVAPIPQDFHTHKYAWLTALQVARDHAEASPPDINDKAYWEHEIRAFQRAYNELEATAPAPAAHYKVVVDALSDLLGQVEKFCCEHGEADFSTRRALEAMKSVCEHEHNVLTPAAQPLTKAQIQQLLKEEGITRAGIAAAFELGVQYAERHHKIGAQK